MNDFKIKKFSGKAEDIHTWKRTFVAALTIKDLGEYLLNPKNASYGDGITAWNKLNELFERKDILGISNLRQELALIKLEEGGDLEEYLIKIHRIVDQIKIGENNKDAVTELA